MIGVDGVAEVATNLGKLGVKLAQKLRQRHADMLDEMVQTAKARVPVDTGELQNGITGERLDDDTFEFRASAVHGAEDYAHDVEYGHAAGGVVVADDDYFAGRSPRDGKGGQVAAEPFFFNSAEEVLHAHGHELSDIVGDTARDDGWETD